MLQNKLGDGKNFKSVSLEIICFKVLNIKIRAWYILANMIPKVKKNSMAALECVVCPDT